MKILAIDPALSTTGSAVLDQKRTLHNVEKFITKNDISEDDRILNIVKYLYEMALKYNVEAIVLEDGFVGSNPRTAIQLAKLRGVIVCHFKFHGFPVDYDLPSHIRKTFGCKGNAKKDEIAAKVLLLYPCLETIIGPYSDKQNKKKTSDMYDAVSIGVGYLNKLDEEKGSPT